MREKMVGDGTLALKDRQTEIGVCLGQTEEGQPGNWEGPEEGDVTEAEEVLHESQTCKLFIHLFIHVLIH